MKLNNLDKLTFTIGKGITLKDLEETSKIVEEEFNPNEDQEQLGTGKELKEWILKKYPRSVNVIKYDNKIIGSSFFIPANEKEMNDFLNNKISERELFQKVKKYRNYNNCRFIYFCSVCIKKEYRNNGIAFKATIEHFKNLINSSKKKLTFFYWGYSEEGKNLAEKLSKELNIKIESRK